MARPSMMTDRPDNLRPKSLCHCFQPPLWFTPLRSLVVLKDKIARAFDLEIAC